VRQSANCQGVNNNNNKCRSMSGAIKCRNIKEQTVQGEIHFEETEFDTIKSII